VGIFVTTRSGREKFSKKQCLGKYSDLVVRIAAADINGIATHPVYARLKNFQHIKII
jgi:hypothetical protein